MRENNSLRFCPANQFFHQKVFKRANIHEWQNGIVGHSNIIPAEGSAIESSDIDRSPFASKIHV